MKNLPSSELPMDLIESGPIDPPLEFPLKTIELQLLKSIKDNFEFHKSIADKIAIHEITTFNGIIEMKVFNDRERYEFIKAECNKIADFLGFIPLNKWLTTLLKKENRDSDLLDRIAKVEALSAKSYQQSINIDRENSGKSVLPFWMNAMTLNDSFVGLNKIWGYQMYYDYLRELLNSEGNTIGINKVNSKKVKEKKVVSIKIHPDYILPIHKILRPYFLDNILPEEEQKRISEELENALKGKVLTHKLQFYNQGNSFAYVFRQLYEKDVILTKVKTEVARWIVANFVYVKNGVSNSEFNYDTVYDILTLKRKPIVPNYIIELNFPHSNSVK